MGGTFKNRKQESLKARAAKLDAEGKKLVTRGRAMIKEARSLRAEANRVGSGGDTIYRPSAALRAALEGGRRLKTKADFERAFRKKLASVNGNVTALASAMDTHRVQIRRWAEALGISMESYR